MHILLYFLNKMIVIQRLCIMDSLCYSSEMQKAAPVSEILGQYPINLRLARKHKSISPNLTAARALRKGT